MNMTELADIEADAIAKALLPKHPGNRFQRRRAAAKKRTRITKREPFGRIAVTEIDEVLTNFDNDRGTWTTRIYYTHTTKGRVCRVLTDALLDQLAA